MQLKIEPKSNLTGKVELPGDKSISHRAVILGALATGKTEIEGFLTGEDCLATVQAVQQLGIKVEGIGTKNLTIYGQGLTGLQQPDDVLDFKNSGTTTRLMLGILAAQKFYTVVTGDKSLRQRPMARVTTPLGRMGGRFAGRDNANLLPITVLSSQSLQPIKYRSPIASAQVKSSILLAGLYTQGVTEVLEPAKSRDHTERMLEYFGAQVEVDGLRVRVTGEAELRGQRIIVPGDISSAAFIIVAGLITSNSDIILKDVGLNPTRAGIIKVLQEMNADLSLINYRKVNGEPITDIKVRSSQLQATEIAGELIPILIDEIPILAVAATQAQGKTIIKDAQELRVKETDRIRAMIRELTRLGIRVTEREDGMEIEGKQKVNGGVTCHSYGDHRVAMSLAILGLIADNDVIIDDAECINVSFPGFNKLLDSL